MRPAHRCIHQPWRYEVDADVFGSKGRADRSEEAAHAPFRGVVDGCERDFEVAAAGGDEDEGFGGLGLCVGTGSRSGEAEVVLGEVGGVGQPDEVDVDGIHGRSDRILVWRGG